MKIIPNCYYMENKYDSFNNSNMDKFNQLKMKRDQDLYNPGNIQSVNSNHNNNVYSNPTINNIPNQLPRNQNIMMQPLQPNYNDLIASQNNIQHQNQNLVLESFGNKKKKKGGILGFFTNIFSNLKSKIILLILFVILSLRQVKGFIRATFPYIKDFESSFPSTIVRGIIMIIAHSILVKLC